MSVDTTVVSYELPDGTTKVSMHSYGTNAYELARKRGGGGHIAAAGFISTNTPEATLKNLLNELRSQRAT